MRNVLKGILHKTKRPNCWIVISGCPASGKTTVIEELNKRGHNTYTQAGEDIIKQRLRLGESLNKIRKDTRLLQYQIAELQVHRERHTKKGQETFWDCGIHDALVFCMYYKIPFPSEFRAYLTPRRYKKVFVLDPLPNESNGVRIESDKDRQQIQDLIKEIYYIYGIETISVPKMSNKKRVDFILTHSSEESS